MITTPISNLLRQKYLIFSENGWSQIVNWNLEAIFIFIILGLGLNQVVPSVEGISYLKFFFSGFIFANVLKATFDHSAMIYIEKISVKEFLMNQKMLPMSSKEILQTEIITDTICGFLSSISILILAWLMDLVQLYQLSIGIFFLLVVSHFFSLMSKSCAILIRHLSTLRFFQLIVLVPMYLLSGVFFSIEVYPKWLSYFVDTLPLTHVVKIYRAFLIQKFDPNLWLSLIIFFGYYLLFYYLINFVVYKKFDKLINQEDENQIA